MISVYFTKKRASCSVCYQKAREISGLVFLQVDYESEEEDDGDDPEDKEDQGVEEAEETAETKAVEEPQANGRRTEKRKKGEKRVEGAESQMRVNSVLESNPAIERYSYDHKHELWCEVSVCVSEWWIPKKEHWLPLRDGSLCCFVAAESLK